MKISLKTEYAFLALIYLSRHYDQGWVRIEQISQTQDIPHKFLETIMLNLKNAGYLKSKRGAGGGYMLSKHPSEIIVADIIRLLDGPIASTLSVSRYFYESTPIEKEPKLKNIFKEIRDHINELLTNTTFEDLI